MSNIPFPTSTRIPAAVNALRDKDILEFTICSRFFIESYNDGAFQLYTNNLFNVVFELPGLGVGWGTDGFQGGVFILTANGHIQGLKINGFLLTIFSF